MNLSCDSDESSLHDQPIAISALIPIPNSLGVEADINTGPTNSLRKMPLGILKSSQKPMLNARVGGNL